jgi:uncharacterized protein YecE (DUF72 family)
MIRICTAGWSIPKAAAAAFAGEGSHLERYARILHGAEINSSFYRPPMVSTWARWEAAVPAGFQFAVKAPKTITHEAKLNCTPTMLTEFLAGASLLGEKLGPLLFQLPPKLAFDEASASSFFTLLRKLHRGPVALEPRHASWFTPEVSQLLSAHGIARVAADPARVPQAALPGGWPGLVYYRLHGSPRMYYSTYSSEYLAELAASMSVLTADAWIVFDNTASGAAAGDAINLSRLVRERLASER